MVRVKDNISWVLYLHLHTSLTLKNLLFSKP